MLQGPHPALSFFIDPDNHRMEYENFVSELFHIGIGKQVSDFSDEDKQLLRGLLSVFDDIKEARKFNETYMGHLLSEASLPGMLGYILAIRLGSNTVAREVSIRESELEPEALSFLKRLTGYDEESASGTFTSGGSMANFTALAVARKLKQRELGSNASSENKFAVFATQMAHYSFDKALDFLGGPYESIEVIRVATENLRMSPSDLETKVKKAISRNQPVMAVFAIAGETETGLVDPLNDIADIAEKYNLFAIADGAYGAPYRISKKGNLFHGLPRFDAIIIDGHKSLYTPYSNGAVLFKNPKQHALLNTEIRADYVGFSEGGNLGEKRVEGSSGAGSILATVAVARTLGLEGLKQIYDITIDRTNHLHGIISKSDIFETVHPLDLNTLCFTLKSWVVERLGFIDDYTADVNFGAWKNCLDRLHKELDNDHIGAGGYFFSTNRLPRDSGGPATPVWRACIMHPRTENVHIDEGVSQLESLIKREIDKKTITRFNGL